MILLSMNYGWIRNDTCVVEIFLYLLGFMLHCDVDPVLILKDFYVTILLPSFFAVLMNLGDYDDGQSAVGLKNDLDRFGFFCLVFHFAFVDE